MTGLAVEARVAHLADSATWTEPAAVHVGLGAVLPVICALIRDADQGGRIARHARAVGVDLALLRVRAGRAGATAAIGVRLRAVLLVIGAWLPTHFVLLASHALLRQLESTLHVWPNPTPTQLPELLH